jgi:ATP-dependent helicase/nuclease subunit B
VGILVARRARNVQETYLQCRNDFGAFADVHIERLSAVEPNGRFGSASLLAHIERNWNTPSEYDSEKVTSACQIWRCGNAEQEATLCAREIWRLVRTGTRFRDIAILPRNLETHADVLARVFHRYEIPFFLDRRESVAHHPLAEITRGVLRMAAFGWRIVDVFAVLKSGLTSLNIDEIDILENAVLKHGWEGEAWKAEFIPNPDRHGNDQKERREDEYAQRVNKSRLHILELFAPFEAELGSYSTAKDIKGALSALWKRLDLETKLSNWSQASNAPIHRTVLEQMEKLFANLQLAFGSRPMELVQWLPIIDAGLGALTVGLIPPALDQVLVGAVDRSRNPDLKVVFIPGFNDGTTTGAAQRNGT